MSATQRAKISAGLEANIEANAEFKAVLLPNTVFRGTFAVGYVPVSVSADISADAFFKISGKLQTGITWSAGRIREQGYSYTKTDGWKRINTNKSTGVDRPQIDTQASLDAVLNAGVEAKLSLKLYDVAGPVIDPTAEFVTDLKATAQSSTTSDPSASLNVEWYIKLSAHLKIEVGLEIFGKFAGVKLTVGSDAGFEAKIPLGQYELRIPSSDKADQTAVPTPSHVVQGQGGSSGGGNPDGSVPDRLATQDLAYCLTNTLPRNDDLSTEAVTLPFGVTFFGKDYVSAFVNNNGNITFDSALSSYTPWALADSTGIPMIAPFFADVDTRGEMSREVTYGASPDGNSFCVNWIGVGYFSEHTDKINSVQLVLQKATGPGTHTGDFDIVFNYDGVRWETGDASGGAGGLGGTSAQVGYTAGTGEPGTWFQMLGSGQNGALLDGGDYALISSSRSSLGQNGRYRFEVRSDRDQVLSGTQSGRVIDDNGQPVAGALVGAVGTGAHQWFVNAYTDANGRYVFNALPTGSAELVASPPSGSGLNSTRQGITLSGGTSATTDLVLNKEHTVPHGMVLTQDGEERSGTPSIYTSATIQSGIRSCHLGGGTATLTQDGQTAFSVPLAQSGDGATATWPTTGFHSGPARMTVTATCSGEDVSLVADVYIDPSGTVVDQNGKPVANAVVSLVRSDSSGGTYSLVPNGSAVLSPGNRINPMLTDSHGRYGWDVIGGYYKVAAQAYECTSMDGADSTESDEMAVPPARLDVQLTLSCTPNTTHADTVHVLGENGKLATADASLVGAAQIVGEVVSDK